MICCFVFVDTAFKQQRLPAWQPIITANTALPVFLIIGLTFIPIGIVLVVTSNNVWFSLFNLFSKIPFFFLIIKIKVLEYDLDYTDTNCISLNVTNQNQTCADYLQAANNSGISCTCVINFQLDNDFKVCFHFDLMKVYLFFLLRRVMSTFIMV